MEGMVGVRRTVSLLVSLTAALVLAGGWALAASPEDLDPSFDGDGRVVTDFSVPEEPHNEGASDMIVQPDGKIVVGGYAQTGSSTDLALARYNTDGSLDSSFDGDGKVTTDIDGGYESVAALSLQSDGKIVVLGGGSLLRYNPDGSLDDTFGSAGKADIDFGADLAIQHDGKIVVGGSVLDEVNQHSDSPYDFALARYNPDGSLDTSFGEGGEVVTAGFSVSHVRALELQNDGKIVLAGMFEDDEDYTDFALARYSPDGSLDDSFSGDGKMITGLTGGDDIASDVAVQPDGKIVVAGHADYWGAVLVRYNPDGSRDTVFENADVYGYGHLEIQDNGQLVALHSNYRWYEQPWGVTRHNTGGGIDRSLSFNSGWGQDEYPEANTMALQPEGKVVLAGTLKNDNGSSDIALSRHLGAAFRDDTKPAGSVTIDGARAITKTRTIELTLEAEDPEPNGSGVFDMRIKNAGDDWNKWTAYERSKTWRLSVGGGSKRVHVQYKDLMGNVSATASDTIRYKP